MKILPKALEIATSNILWFLGFTWLEPYIQNLFLTFTVLVFLDVLVLHRVMETLKPFFQSIGRWF